MVSKSPVVDLIGDFGDLFPGFTSVGGLENREVDEWGLWTIVLPGCEKHAAFKLHCTSVEDLRVCVVGRRNEDSDIGEGREGKQSWGSNNCPKEARSSSEKIEMHDHCTCVLGTDFRRKQEETNNFIAPSMPAMKLFRGIHPPYHGP